LTKPLIQEYGVADYILAPQTITVNFALDPALNTFNNVMLMLQVDERSGFSDWITRTAAALSPERKRILSLTSDGLYGGIIPESHWMSFPAYLDDLAQRDAVVLRDKAFSWICSEEKAAEYKFEPLPLEVALADREAYVSAMRQMHQTKHGEKDPGQFDETFFVELHELMQNPDRMLELLVENLRILWNDVLREDWEHHQAMLRDSVEAFHQLDYSGSTPLQAIRAVTGRDLSGHWEATLGNAKQITFVPSAHIGPYLTWYGNEVTGIARIVFGARLPEGTRYESPALSRSELLVRLSALADDTRLQMLELLTRHEELCAQDIMAMLELSQSSTSRHLRQLTATGYLVERRREVAKCYTLNPARFEDTMRALKRFARSK
jgi:DNA-binding transcriptional ArsR family regulator